MALSFIQSITLSLSLLQRMASNDDDKHKMEEEAESSMARKRLWLSDDDSSDSPEEEVSSEESSMNQLDTSKEKLYAKRARSILFSNDGDTPSTSLERCTPGSRQCSDEESSDD
jgi:hypothetical protein